MTEKEALIRVKTGNFNGSYGFDMQLLVDSVGIIGEMFKNGQISEVVRCEECKWNRSTEHNPICEKHYGVGNVGWFCADGERR